MSIILKGNNINYNNNGITPEDLTASISQDTDKITIRLNIRNVVKDNIQLTNINKFIVVKNENRVPLNANDGEIVYNQRINNLGSSTGYRQIFINDTNVVIYKTYYYRFFIYDSSGSCNSNLMKEVQFLKLDSILKNNTWEQITAASENGMAQSMWNIGDEIDVELKAYTDSENNYYSIAAQTITLQIWGFNHFDKVNSTGKAGICFGMKNLTKENLPSPSQTNNEYWDVCPTRNKTLKNIYEHCLPTELKNCIKKVITYAYNQKNSTNVSSEDNLFLAGAKEVFGSKSVYDNGHTNDISKFEQEQFPIFTNSNSRIKLSGSNPSIWFTRDRVPGVTNVYYIPINESGNEGESIPSFAPICFCFNI